MKTAHIVKLKFSKWLTRIRTEGVTEMCQAYLDKVVDKHIAEVDNIEKGSYIRMKNQDKHLTKLERSTVKGMNKLTKINDLDLSYEEYEEQLRLFDKEKKG